MESSVGAEYPIYMPLPVRYRRKIKPARKDHKMSNIPIEKWAMIPATKLQYDVRQWHPSTDAVRW